MLVVEDDHSYGLLLRYQLENAGYTPVLTRSGEEGLQKLRETDPAAVLLDVNLPGKKGPEVLEEIHAISPELPVVMMTAAGTIELAVECMKRGAYDFMIKPLEVERLQAILRNAHQNRDLRNRVRFLEGALSRRHAFDQIIAFAPAMRSMVEQAQRASQTDMDVLVLGESGTGKEVFARAIHFNSARHKGPFVAINCGAIPEGLLESELFGHEKGAFTGASARRAGCFEQAHGGTLFLDEIGEMRPDMQVRFAARAGTARSAARGRRPHAARRCTRDFRDQSRPERTLERSEIPHRFVLPARHFGARTAADARTDRGYRPAGAAFPARSAPRRTHSCVDHFARGPGRADEVSVAGNVRELRNAIERAVVFEDSETISVGSLPPDIIRHVIGQQAVPPPKLTDTLNAASIRALLASQTFHADARQRAGCCGNREYASNEPGKFSLPVSAAGGETSRSGGGALAFPEQLRWTATATRFRLRLRARPVKF